jgi:RNA polymerase sigma factor (sigma-70 family)
MASGMSTSRAASAFAPTRWTLVLRARGAAPEAQRALGELCEAYWQPVFRFLRREGRNDDTARELTQEFFARLLARPGLAGVEPGRGRFRAYLLGAVKHFLAEERDRARAAKRGGGQVPVSLDAEQGTDTATGLTIPDPSAMAPDAFFDRQWAVTTVDRAVAALAAEAEAGGRGAQFAALKPWLLGEVPALSQAETARELGLSEGAVKVAVHRLRKRFRELVKAEIAQTINDPDQVQDELRYLIEVLAHPGAG